MLNIILLQVHDYEIKEIAKELKLPMVEINAFMGKVDTIRIKIHLPFLRFFIPFQSRFTGVDADHDISDVGLFSPFQPGAFALVGSDGTAPEKVFRKYSITHNVHLKYYCTGSRIQSGYYPDAAAFIYTKSDVCFILIESKHEGYSCGYNDSDNDRSQHGDCCFHENRKRHDR